MDPRLKFKVFCLFPEIIEAYFSSSIMAKAVEKGVIGYECVNIRDYARDKHHKCDDAPYGGGAGMLMLPEPIDLAFKAHGALGKRVVYLSPSGRLLDQAYANELSRAGELYLLCGRYEGVDQRIIDRYVTDEVSIGDYVLSSGEVAALALIDAAYRLVEGVISPDSLGEESFSKGLLEYPQYTRPEIYDSMPVPEPLLSGHHANIARWRLERSIRKTLQYRPELIDRARSSGMLDPEALKLLASIEGVKAKGDTR